MYVFVDKKTRAVVHVASVSPDDKRAPGEIFLGFDPEKMDAGRAPDQFIPAKFEIKDGVVVDLDPPPGETLEQARARKKQELTDQALTLRRALAPDYQLMDAGLGIYDEARTATLKATVNAFREEVKRLEEKVAAAKAIKDLDKLVPKFPTALVVVKTASSKPK